MQQTSRLTLAIIILPVLMLLSDCDRASPATLPDGTVPRPAQPNLILLTTTSVRDSGLLDIVVAGFQEQTGYVVKPIVAGSGQVLELGAKGEGDVLLTHSPTAEERWMAAGYGLSRKIVMFNDFLILGPADDPAGLRGSPSTSAALRRLAAKAALFISRGDGSGTHRLERQLWKQAGVVPTGGWYQESGTGQGQTMQIAAQKEGHVLTDRGTYLVVRHRVALVPLVERTGPELLNPYHVMVVSPTRGPRVNAAGGKAFANYLVSDRMQALIRDFGKDRFGQSLFFPASRWVAAELGLESA